MTIARRRQRDLLWSEAQAAVEHGKLPAGTDAHQLAFELGTVLAGTDVVSVLHVDLQIVDRARNDVRSRLPA